MKTDPRVLAASMEKLSTLPEESVDSIEIKTPIKSSKEEMNNNINNNNRKLLLTQISAVSTSSIDSVSTVFTDSDSMPGTPVTPTTPIRSMSAGEWIGMGTYRRRKLSKERTRSLKEENEDLGLENIIPRHRSPKALSEMGKPSSNHGGHIYCITHVFCVCVDRLFFTSRVYSQCTV